jgi:hypothetical protein
LLRGSSGIGKWLTALSYADDHGGAVIAMRDEPTVEQARRVAALYQQRPIGGSFTVSLIDLDRCSDAIQNVLLKTIEEMPEWGKVILVASEKPLPTITSRCRIIEFQSLTEAQVSDVLSEIGIPPAEATVLAALSGGSVEVALRYRDALRVKPLVLQYVDALIRHDRGALSAMLPRWTDDATVLLWRWINEVLSSYPRVFSKAELGLVHKLGVDKFYEMVGHMRAKDSPDLVAMKVWKK